MRPAWTLKPNTANKTGIDDYGQVDEIAAAAMAQGYASAYYANAALLQMPPKTKTIATGFLAADSLWKYLGVAVGIADQPEAGVPVTGKKYTTSYQMQNNPHPFNDIGCDSGCGDMSTPLSNATGVLDIIGVSASFTSSYTLRDEAQGTVSASGTWQDSPSTALSLSGTFSCTAPTHEEPGIFTSSSDWISMSAGYLQPLTTPVWKAIFQSQGDECASTCAGDARLKPLRLTPQ